MSGSTILSPDQIDTTLLPDGQVSGTIVTGYVRSIVDSAAGLFSQSPFSTSQIITAAQRGTLLPFNVSTAVTLTIPTNATVAIPIGCIYHVLLLAAATGTLQIVGAAGVTVNSNSANPATPFLRGPSSFAFFYQRTANIWYVGGDLL